MQMPWVPPLGSGCCSQPPNTQRLSFEQQWLHPQGLQQNCMPQQLQMQQPAPLVPVMRGAPQPQGLQQSCMPQQPQMQQPAPAVPVMTGAPHVYNSSEPPDAVSYGPYNYVLQGQGPG